LVCARHCTFSLARRVREASRGTLLVALLVLNHKSNWGSSCSFFVFSGLGLCADGGILSQNLGAQLFCVLHDVFILLMLPAIHLHCERESDLSEDSYHDSDDLMNSDRSTPPHSSFH
jgi:hypothetical protein